jgi:hypothetical protein
LESGFDEKRGGTVRLSLIGLSQDGCLAGKRKSNERRFIHFPHFWMVVSLSWLHKRVEFASEALNILFSFSGNASMLLRISNAPACREFNWVAFTSTALPWSRGRSDPLKKWLWTFGPRVEAILDSV